MRARLLERNDETWLLRFFPESGDLRALLPRLGEVPLPPYIHAQADEARYQTIYAREAGGENALDSAAAPTAGLHFTPQLFERLEARGIERALVTLGVGVGTFRPVKVENLDEHAMHAEEFWIAPEVAARINAHKANGGRVVAVGTTTVRALEGAARNGQVRAGAGETRLFLRPGARLSSCGRVDDQFSSAALDVAGVGGGVYRKRRGGKNGGRREIRKWRKQFYYGE